MLHPIIIKMKIMLQQICKLNVDWDSVLPDNLRQTFFCLLSFLKENEQIEVPRYIFDIDKNELQFPIELHGFSDASLQACGAVIYSNCLSKSSNITTNLIASKSRVAPIKPTVISRLELLGNLLLARLMKNVEKVFQNLGYTVKTCFWTDFKVTLSWIFADSKVFEVFVQNRLKEIRSISKKENWHFCSRKNNPADILTREERKISDFHKHQF